MKYLMTIWSRSPKDYFIIDHLINHLRKKKKSVTLIYQKENSLSNSVDKINCNKHRISYSKYSITNKIYFIYYLIYLFFFILIKKPDIFIIFNNYPLVIIYLIKLFYKGKLIYHNFDHEPFSKKKIIKILNFIEKQVIQDLDKVIFSNQKRADLLKKIIRKKVNIDIVYNCLPINFFKKKNNFNKIKNINIFRIGSIGPGHGLMSLIKSFKYLPDNYNLIICGIIVDKNFHKNLLNIINKNKIKKKINIFISVPQKVWMQKMINSDLGVAFYEPVNTSHRHMVGASQKINSYLAAGLPIILSNEKQFKLFSKKYGCSVNTDINNPKEIAKKIKHTISNKLIFNRLKIKSELAFKSQFNFEKQINKIEYYS